MFSSNNNLSTALCPARQKLSDYKERRAFSDQKIDLEDWVLPIVYQNKDVHFERQPMTPQEETAFLQQQKALYRAPQQPSYGFIGRDLDILYIEKLLLMKRNLLLIRGMGGAGKTTLLHHLAWWWQRTGMVQQVFYFGYDEQAWTRQQLMRTIAKELLDKEDFAIFQSRSAELQQLQLTQLLRITPHLIILDNLESITGTHLAIRHTLSKKEQGNLHDLLAELVGGQTFVLLGSRSSEDWLARGTFEDNRYDLVLGMAADRQQKLRQFKTAIRLYQNILQILETASLDTKQRHILQAKAYHQLGIVAGEQWEWAKAKEYFELAWQIFVEYNDLHEQARMYLHLGVVAQEQREWTEAKGIISRRCSSL